MNLAILIISFLAFARSSVAHDQRPCIDFKVAVAVQANNTIYYVPRVDSNVDAVDLVWNLTVWSGLNATARVKAPNPVQGTFGISARLCVPFGQPKAGILQIATHGLAFDKRYWDSARRPDTNSYVNAALKAGYSILIYDRLGVGQSDKPDAYEITQAPLEVEILNQLAILARSGKLVPPSLTIKNVQVPAFSKIVLVGHSFGTIVSSGVMSKYGNTIDGAVFTALVVNSKFTATGIDSFGWEYAPENDRKRFGNFPSGTLVQASISNVQQIFMKKGAFELDMLDYAEKIKQPIAVGELLSVDAIFPRPAPLFTGPLLIALAQYDYPVCGGDCVGTVNITALKLQFWPKTSNVSLHIQSGSGHGLTLHKNAPDEYQAILSYLNERGL